MIRAHQRTQAVVHVSIHINDLSIHGAQVALWTHALNHHTSYLSIFFRLNLFSGNALWAHNNLLRHFYTVPIV
jgi:hypothetical protein